MGMKFWREINRQLGKSVLGGLGFNHIYFLVQFRGFPDSSVVKNLPIMQETLVQFLCWEVQFQFWVPNTQ